MVVDGDMEVSKSLTMKFGDDDFQKTDKVLRRHKSQDDVIFGEVALIGQVNRLATMVAKTECVLLETERISFV